MKRGSAIAALLLAALLCLGLTACGGGGLTATEATVYVQGLLDRTYLGQYNEDYMKLVDTDEASMEQIYQDGLQTEAEYFCYYFDLYAPSDELKEDVADFYAELYSRSKYEVHPASKLSSGGYAVEVVVRPLDLISRMADRYSGLESGYWGGYTQEDVDAMTDEEYIELDNQWGYTLLDLAYELLPEVDYLDPVYLTVQVRQDDDGLWSLVETDFSAIDNAIIEY